MTDIYLSEKIKDKLNELKFGELRELIDNCTKMEKEKIADENLFLFTTNPDLLNEYAKYLEEKIIPCPTPPQLPPDFPFREPRWLRDQLSEMNDELEKLNEELKNSRLLPKSVKAIRKRQKKINSKQERIELIKKQIKEYEEEFPKAKSAKDELLKKRGVYKLDSENYKIDLSRYQLHHKILDRILRDISAANWQKLHFTQLNWKFFPKGQWTAEGIIKEFGKYVSKDEKIDEKRLRKIVDNLKPTHCYIGEERFNRYIAFCFEGREKVILECPIYGNAIYVIKGNWQEITKLHKWEARQSSKVTVICHNETWFSRLQSTFNSRY